MPASEDLLKKTVKKIDDAKNSKIGSGEEQFVIFNIGHEEFGVNINDVLEITKLKDITRVPNTEDYIEGVINLRGRIHVVINLAKKLKVPPKIADENTRIIIVETKNDRVGMLVDSVREVLRVSEQNIKPAPDIISKRVNNEYITGVVILGGRLIIKLNLANVLGVDELKELEGVKTAVAATP